MSSTLEVAQVVPMVRWEQLHQHWLQSWLTAVAALWCKQNVSRGCGARLMLIWWCCILISYSGSTSLQAGAFTFQPLTADPEARNKIWQQCPLVVAIMNPMLGLKLSYRPAQFFLNMLWYLHSFPLFILEIPLNLNKQKVLGTVRWLSRYWHLQPSLETWVPSPEPHMIGKNVLWPLHMYPFLHPYPYHLLLKT